jgi:plasmid maintenance system antidote protein VapI
MENIHMGQLLEKVIRRKEINITELAAALNITRRTLYNWFKQEIIDEGTMQRISDVIVYDFSSDTQIHTIINLGINRPAEEASIIKNEAYWQDRYINLLEHYSELIKAHLKIE